MPMRRVVAGAPSADPRRGEIYEVNLDPAKGREQKERRYCLVVSGDPLNTSGLGTVMVCPMTTREKKRFLWRTRLDPADVEVIDQAWEVETSWVQSDQIVTLDVEDGRFLRHVGTVRNPPKLAAVTRSIYEMFRP
jgi:mRNA interferase MazF